MKQEMIFVKPKEDVKIRRPDTMQFLREEGEKVPKSTFWVKRLKDGDVVEVGGSKKEEGKEEPKRDKKRRSSEKKNDENHGGEEL